MRVLLVAEHASARFGGEAALPLHYYRVLRARGVPVWLLTHARVRDELTALFPQDVGTRIRFVEDSAFHRLMWRIGRRLPDRLSYATTGFLSRLSTQWVQRRQAQRLVREEGITVVHQPMPVSPKEPSLLFGLGAPVVMGPMNGGMAYPPAFRAQQSALGRVATHIGRQLSWLLNLALPGKRRAAMLLVANERTRRALPRVGRRPVRELVENGVDLSVWRPPADRAAGEAGRPVRFAFLGRLVDWKAVNLLLDAFAQARRSAPMSLTVIGDGPEGPALKAQAERLGVAAHDAQEAGGVAFAGWLSQRDAARLLAQHDVLVLPSLFECGGAVVLEAMAMGLPVIATDWGGPADYLDAGCGVLVPPSSRGGLRDGLAAAMGALAADAPRRAEMGRQGRARVERHFDWDRKVDAMLDLYAEAARGAP